MEPHFSSLTPQECYHSAWAVYLDGEQERKYLHEHINGAQFVDCKELNGWKFSLYKINDEHLVSFRGTQSLMNWGQNIVRHLKLCRRGLPNIEKIICDWEMIHKISVKAFTGHSEGGYFASNVMKQRKLQRVTFNGTSTGDDGIHLRTHGDIVSLCLGKLENYISIGEGGHQLPEFAHHIAGKTWKQLADMGKAFRVANPSNFKANEMSFHLLTGKSEYLKKLEIQERCGSTIDWLRKFLRLRIHKVGLAKKELIDDLLSPLMVHEGDKNTYFEKLMGVATCEQEDLVDKILELDPPLLSQGAQEAMGQLIQDHIEMVSQKIEEAEKGGKSLWAKLLEDKGLQEDISKILGTLVRGFAHSQKAIKKADESERKFEARLKELARDRLASCTPVDYVPFEAQLRATLASPNRLYQTIHELEIQRKEIKQQGQEIRDALALYQIQSLKGEKAVKEISELYKSLVKKYRKSVGKRKAGIMGVNLLIDIAQMSLGFPPLVGHTIGKFVHSMASKSGKGTKKRMEALEKSAERHTENVISANQHADQEQAHLVKFVQFLKNQRPDLMPAEYREELSRSMDSFRSEMRRIAEDQTKNSDILSKINEEIARIRKKIKHTDHDKERKKLKAKLLELEGKRAFYQQQDDAYKREGAKLSRQIQNSEEELAWEHRVAPFRDGLYATISSMRSARSSGNQAIDLMRRDLLEGREQFLKERQIDSLPVRGLCGATGLLTHEILTLFFGENQSERMRFVGKKTEQVVELLTHCYELYDMMVYWTDFAIPSLMSMGEVWSQEDVGEGMTLTEATQPNGEGVMQGVNQAGSVLSTIFSAAGITTYIIPGMQLIAGVLKGIGLIGRLFGFKLSKSNNEILLEEIQKMLRSGLEALGKHLDKRFEEVHRHLEYNHKQYLEEFKTIRSQIQRNTFVMMQGLDNIAARIEDHVDEQTFLQQVVKWQEELVQFQTQPLTIREQRYHEMVASNANPLFCAYTKAITASGAVMATVPETKMPLQPEYFTGYIGKALGMKGVGQAKRFLELAKSFMKDAKGNLTRRPDVISLLMQHSTKLVELGERLELGATAALEAQKNVARVFNELAATQKTILQQIWKQSNKTLLTEEKFWEARKPHSRFTLRYALQGKESHWDVSTDPNSMYWGINQKSRDWVSYYIYKQLCPYEPLRLGNSEIPAHPWEPSHHELEDLAHCMLDPKWQPDLLPYDKKVQRFLRDYAEEVDLFFHGKEIEADPLNAEIKRPFERLIKESYFVMPEVPGQIPLAFPKKLIWSLINKLPKKVVKSLACNHCMIPTYSFTKTDDKFVLTVSIRDNEGKVLCSSQNLASFDEDTFKYFREVTFFDGIRVNKGVRELGPASVELRGVSVRAFLIQMMYAEAAHLGLPGKGSKLSWINPRTSFSRPLKVEYDPDADRLDEKEKEFSTNRYSLPIPIDHPFPGLWEILSEEPEVALEYNSASYDGAPETLKGMLRPQNIQVNMEMLETGLDKPGVKEAHLEQAYSEYLRAYKILETQGLWSADVSSEELKEMLWDDLGLLDPKAISLEDLCSGGMMDAFLLKERDAGSFVQKMKAHEPSKSLMKVYDVQRKLVSAL